MNAAARHEARARALAKAIWTHHWFKPSQFGGGFSVELLATTPPLRGAVLIERMCASQASIAWRRMAKALERRAHQEVENASKRAARFRGEAEREEARAQALRSFLGVATETSMQVEPASDGSEAVAR